MTARQVVRNMLERNRRKMLSDVMTLQLHKQRAVMAVYDSHRSGMAEYVRRLLSTGVTVEYVIAELDDVVTILEKYKEPKDDRTR